MKTSPKLTRIFCTLSFILFIIPNSNAQLWKKLKKKAEKAIERKLEQKIEKEAEKTMDSILNPNQTPSTKKSPESTSTKETENNSSEKIDEPNSISNKPKELKVNTKFDFVPGDKLLFFDDFSNDFIGDFPSKWDTNGTGEVVTFNETTDKWFEFTQGYSLQYTPVFDELPKEYTIEFDLLVKGLDKSNIFGSALTIQLDDNEQVFEEGKNNVTLKLPFNLSSKKSTLHISNNTNTGNKIHTPLEVDIRELLSNSFHISIAVNKQRFRFWINQKKYIDVPRMIGLNVAMKTLKFNFTAHRLKQQRIFINNLKIAEGGLDLRSKLISEGRVSTNGILFNSGSSKIKIQSYGIIRQIYQVLLQDKTMKLKIIGHTDSDGDSQSNLKLSKDRAENIKNTLISIYKISEDRLQSEGKGENFPIGDNNTIEGKSENRRVEFIKL